VNVKGLETRFGEGIGHLHMRVDALLAQDGDLRSGQVQEGCRQVDGRIEGQRHVQAGVGGIASHRVFGIRAGRVVALLADLPAHAVPDLVQVLQLGGKHLLGVAPDAEFALAPGKADDRGRVLPMKWLCLDRPCSRRVCITALRSAVAPAAPRPTLR
jgi:hypothetical protein